MVLNQKRKRVLLGEEKRIRRKVSLTMKWRKQAEIPLLSQWTLSAMFMTQQRKWSSLDNINNVIFGGQNYASHGTKL